MLYCRDMAIVPQRYPRNDDGFLDVDQLPPHHHKIPFEQLKSIIREAIEKAGKKSSRAILDIPDETSEEDRLRIYREKGKALFSYFRRYYGDPATSAYDCHGRHFSVVAKEQFRNQTLQKERMNSGWRYQYIAKDCAVSSKRFMTISDIGAAEADFNATIDVTGSKDTLICSRRIEARGGFEPVEQIVRRQSVPLDRLRVAVGDLDREPSADGKACCLDGGEWPCPLGLLAGAPRWADPPAALATLHGESGERVSEFAWLLCRSGCDCGRLKGERRLFGTHEELLHSTGVRGSRAGEREGAMVILAPAGRLAA